jgi:hypothetical protein
MIHDDLWWIYGGFMVDLWWMFRIFVKFPKGNIHRYFPTAFSIA